MSASSPRLARLLFQAVTAVGRPFGGIPPRRYTHSLGRLAFPPGSLAEQDWRWVRSRWGDELWLNPYYSLDRSIIAFGAYDTVLHEFLEDTVTPGMVCLDVGANIGDTAVQLARKVGPAGTVHAFEPLPWLCDRLRKNLERNGVADRVRINSMVLLDAPGESRIWAADTSHANQGMASAVCGRGGALSVAVSTRATTLDEYAAANRLTRIDLVKIDVQGAEARLLAGGEQVLRTLVPRILIEVSPSELQAGGTTSRDLLRRIEECGYQVRLLKRHGVTVPVKAKALSSDFFASNVLCVGDTRSV